MWRLKFITSITLNSIQINDDLIHPLTTETNNMRQRMSNKFATLVRFAVVLVVAVAPCKYLVRGTVDHRW